MQSKTELFFYSSFINICFYSQDYCVNQSMIIYLQIVVGGRNKYLINGHLAQPNRVQNLFHSVQLNVNNPHFLIMQGRITKVLNMKPPEILSMLEEAAGTRMYETKKEAALKTLEKKQSKVDDIDKLLDQEILPALEKLRKERMQYMQWANGNAELDRLKRFCIAYEYVQAEKVMADAIQGLEGMKSKITEIDSNVGKMQEEIQEMEKRASELQAEKDANMGGEMKLLTEKVDALSCDVVKETSFLKNQEDILKTEKKNCVKVRTSYFSALPVYNFPSSLSEISLYFSVTSLFLSSIVIMSLGFNNDTLTLQIKKNLEELKQSAEEKVAAVSKAEEGASDLKKRAEELSISLEAHEKEYQVSIYDFLWG